MHRVGVGRDALDELVTMAEVLRNGSVGKDGSEEGGEKVKKGGKGRDRANEAKKGSRKQ